MTTAYPLTWPAGWRRTASDSRKQAQFGKTERVSFAGGGGYSSKKELTIFQAMTRLFTELERLGADDWILSTNVETRQDGTPRSDRRAPDDPGVAVYFKMTDRDRVLACDKWNRVADNIAAVAAHIDALRRQERYGVGSLDQAFAGYTALPAPQRAQERPWHVVLGCRPDADADEIKTMYRWHAQRNHPDNGGDGAKMAEINAAYQAAKKEREAG